MSLVYKGNIVSRIKPWHLNQCPAAAHHTLSQGGNCILSGGEGVDHAPRLCSGWKWNSSLWKKCKTVTKKNIITHRRSQGRQWSRKFSAYLIILCFEKRRPKQKYCFSPKSNISTPSKFFPQKKFGTGCATVIVIEPFYNSLNQRQVESHVNCDLHHWRLHGVLVTFVFGPTWVLWSKKKQPLQPAILFPIHRPTARLITWHCLVAERDLPEKNVVESPSNMKVL